MSAKSPVPAATHRDLAEALGCDLRTISRWARMEGFPLDPTVSNVKEWAAARGKKAVGLNELRSEKLLEEIEGAKLRNAKLRGELLPRPDMEAFVAKLAQRWDTLLRQKLEVELGPRCLGKNAAEISLEGSAILDEIRAVCESGLGEWKAPGDA